MDHAAKLAAVGSSATGRGVRTKNFLLEQPTQKRTLVSTAYDRLRRDILHGVLRPGERLRFSLLAETYGFGMSTMREALVRLVGDALVVSVDQRGFTVSAVSKHDLADLLRTRLLIEEAALRRSIEFGNVEWEVGVMTAHHRLLKAGEQFTSDPRIVDDAWEVHHAAFHLSLLSACESPMLLQFYSAIHLLGDRYRRLYLRYAVRQRDHLREHTALKEAVLCRDAEAAVGVLRAHLTKTVEELSSHDWGGPASDGS